MTEDEFGDFGVHGEMPRKRLPPMAPAVIRPSLSDQTGLAVLSVHAQSA
jgi:hypothetical protein